MRTFFSSFGIGLQRSKNLSHSYFARMPPAVFSRSFGEFVPDFSSLLLSSELIVDAETLERLEGENERAFNGYSATLKRLVSQGIVRALDYSQIVHENRDELRTEIDRDIDNSWAYLEAFSASQYEWQQHLSSFLDKISEFCDDTSLEVHDKHSASSMKIRELTHMARADGIYVNRMSRLIGHLKASPQAEHDLKMLTSNSETARHYKSLLRPYFEYLNVNLLLSEKFEAAVFDWADMVPLYQKKTELHGQEYQSLDHPNALKNLLRFSFPDVSEWPTESVVEMMSDKRVQSLRDTIDEAIRNEEQIDELFVLRKFGEIVGVQHDIAKSTRMISYLASPIGLVPILGSVVQKSIEELSSSVVARKKRQKVAWYFMVSEQVKKISE